MTPRAEIPRGERNVQPIGASGVDSPSRRHPPLHERLALVIGVGDYPRGRRVANPARDARAVARVLEGQLGFRVTRLLDAEATSAAVRRRIRDQLDSGHESSQWLFYFAGHGEAAGPSTESRLVLHDEAHLRLSRLVDGCLDSRHRQTLLILDACHAGGALIRREALAEVRQGDLAGHHRVRQIVCAGNAEQQVLDGGGRGHSVFTQVLLESLVGWLPLPFGRGPRTIAFRDLLVLLQNEVEVRLDRLGVPEARRQDTVGGNLVGTSNPSGFKLHHPSPWLTPGCVERARSDDPADRIRALAECVQQAERDRDTLPMAIELALRSVPSKAGSVRTRSNVSLRSAPDPGAREREEAARTLGRLAAIGDGSLADGSVAGSLFRLAVKDRSARVRYRARTALRSCSRPSRRSIARAANALSRGRKRPERRRAWHTATSLPEARHRLPPWRHAAALSTLAALRLLQAGRVIAGTRSVRLVAGLMVIGIFGLYLYLVFTWHLGVVGNRVAVRLGHPGLTGLPGAGEPLVVTEVLASDLPDPDPVREGRIRGTWASLVHGGTPWAPALLDQLDPAEAGLAGWRLGRTGEALTRLRCGVEDGDPASLRTAAYLGLRPGVHLRPILDLIDAASAGGSRMDEEVRAAMRALSIARPHEVSRIGPEPEVAPPSLPERDPGLEEPVDGERLFALVTDPTSVGRAGALARLVDCRIAGGCSGDRLTGTLLAGSVDPDPWVRREAQMGILFLHPILPDLGDPARLRAVLEELAETVGSNPPVGGIDRPRFARRLARSPPASRSAVIDALVSRALDSDEHVGSWTRRAVAELVEHQPELLEDVTSIATTVVIAETRAPPGLDLLLFQVGSTASPESIRRTVLRLLTRAETTREIARAVAYGTVATHLAIRDESLATETAFRLAELARPADPGLLRVWLRSQELLLRGYPLLSDVIASDLVRALKSEDPEIRRFALEIASGSGGSGDLAPSVASALLPALVDPDPAVRALAARGAARWGRGARHPEEPAPLAARLAAALESEDEPAARVETAVSLGILAGSDRSLSARAWRALDTTHAPPRPDDPTGARAEIERAMRIGIANPFSARQALPRIARHLNAEESRARFAVLAVREVGMEDSRVAENALEMLEPRLADPSWPVAWDGVVNGVLPLCRAHPELAERGVAILRPVLALPRPPSVHGLRLELRAAYDGMVELAAILTGDDLDAIWLWVTSLRPIDRRVGRDLLVRLAWRRADTHPELEERMATLVIAPRPVDRIAVARTREIVGLLSIRHSLGANGLRAEDWQWLLEWIPDRSVSTTLREVSSSADL